MIHTAAEVARLPWVQAVCPIGLPYEARLSEHSPLRGWHVDVEFIAWPVPPELAERWKDEDVNAAETWRKRPLAAGVDCGCPYGCGEVELAARLRNAGYQAFWISEWSGFSHVECWRAFCVTRSEMKERAGALWSFDRRLRSAPSNSGLDLGASGGHPDVAAWEPEHGVYVYLEYKGPGDAIKPKQNRWAQAVVAQEAPRLAYVVVRGSFEGQR